MCGIAGLVQHNPKVLSDILKSMDQSLAHRGPDEHGCILFGDGNDEGDNNYSFDSPWTVALIHRRLSILDLSKAGRQPMSTVGGKYHIVFNGEIYNYIELRAELVRYGYQFLSNSDTEVLLTAFSHWGADALNRFVGMFAFAIYDSIHRELFIARDFFGIKPLYYTMWPGGFAFASEIKTLLNLSWIKRKINPQRLYDYLRFGKTDHGSQTLFSEIQQLPAAHHLVVRIDDPNNISINPYWRIDTTPHHEMSFKEAAEALRDLFLDSVRIHLRSDVPLGTALSGGIDSSAIVNSIRYLEPQIDIHAFSYITSDNRLSEDKWITIAANKAKAKVHRISVTAEDLLADLDHLIYMQDEPFASTSIYAQFCVFKLARENGIKVMLDGQGADELLAGYAPYVGARFASQVRSGDWSGAVNFALHVTCLPGHGKGLLHAAKFLAPPKFQEFFRQLIGKELVPAWLNRSWFENRNVSMAHYVDHKTDKDILISELKNSLTGVLPQLLRYEDRNSMAHSIESRVPFLTPALANFILSLPEEYLLSPEGLSKSVFRAAMRDIVPNEILLRKDKIGFATSEGQWLAQLTPWVQDLLKSEVAHDIPALNLKAIWATSKRNSKGQGNFDFHVWRWINLILWAKVFKVQF